MASSLKVHLKENIALYDNLCLHIIQRQNIWLSPALSTECWDIQTCFAGFGLAPSGSFPKFTFHVSQIISRLYADLTACFLKINLRDNCVPVMSIYLELTTKVWHLQNCYQCIWYSILNCHFGERPHLHCCKMGHFKICASIYGLGTLVAQDIALKLDTYILKH